TANLTGTILNSNSAGAGAGGASFCSPFSYYCNLPPGGNGGNAFGGGVGRTRGWGDLTYGILEKKSSRGGSGGQPPRPRHGGVRAATASPQAAAATALEVGSTPTAGPAFRCAVSSWNPTWPAAGEAMLPARARAAVSTPRRPSLLSTPSP